MPSYGFDTFAARRARFRSESRGTNPKRVRAVYSGCPTVSRRCRIDGAHSAQKFPAVPAPESEDLVDGINVGLCGVREAVEVQRQGCALARCFAVSPDCTSREEV